MLTTLAYISSAILYFGLLILSLVKNWKSNVNLSFSLFLLGLALWISTLYLYFFVDLGNYLIHVSRLNYTANIFTPVGLFAFFYFFPNNQKAPFLIFSTAVLEILLLTFITQFTALIIKNETYTINGPEIEFGLLYPIFILHVLFYLVAAFAIGIYRFKQLQGINALRIIYPLLAFTVSCFVLLVNNAILPLFGIQLFWEYSFLIMIPASIIAFYAIHKYRFIQVSNTILQIIRLTLLVCIFMITIIGSHFLFSKSIHSSLDIITSIVESLIALLITYLASKHLPEFISEDLRYFREVLRKFSYQLYGCRTYNDFREALEETFLIQLNLKNTEIYFVSPRKTKSSIPIYTGVSLSQALLKTKDLLVLSELQARHEPENETLAAKMKELNAEICLPLRRDNNLIGFLALGAKGSDQLFSKEEIDVLHSLEETLVVSFTNILLKSDLQHEVDSLKKIIEQKTKRIKKQRQEFRELSEKQAEFISVSSHELRTPLTIALLQSQKLLRKEDIPGLQMISDSLEKLNHLIKTLFDAQLFDLAKIHPLFTKVTIKVYFSEIVNDVRFLLKSKSLKLKTKIEVSEQSKAQIDSTLMSQVMHNLIANAAKFSPPGKTIHLKISEDNKNICFALRDEGAGIDTKILNLIFEKFWSKSKRNTDSDPGVGLGLYICKKIIELHKGKIWAENSLEGGAQINFELPKC